MNLASVVYSLSHRLSSHEIVFYLHIYIYRSPDDFHHHVNATRGAVESPSAHFQRVEAHNHHVCQSIKRTKNIFKVYSLRCFL